jgi:hypothetical protein
MTRRRLQPGACLRREQRPHRDSGTGSRCCQGAPAQAGARRDKLTPDLPRWGACAAWSPAGSVRIYTPSSRRCPVPAAVPARWGGTRRSAAVLSLAMGR